MSSPLARIRERMTSLSRRERLILLCLVALVLVFGADFLFNKVYLERGRELRAAVARAQEQVLHNQRLLSREELIHAQYKKLESPAAAVEDSVLTETEVLRELSELADRTVHVKSVVPRLGHHEGKQVMFVALDFEGPFEAVVGYVEKILNEMPSEVGSLSLAPRSDVAGGVICRMAIRVDCFES